MTRAAQAAEPDGYTIARRQHGHAVGRTRALSQPQVRSRPRASRRSASATSRRRPSSPRRTRRPPTSRLHRLPQGQPARSSAMAMPASARSRMFQDAVQFEVRPQAGAGRLPRHRSGPQRPGRRPDRLHGRPVAQRDPADQGRHHQGLCHRRARAARKPARMCPPPRRRASTSFSAPGTRWSRRRGRPRISSPSSSTR